MATKDEKKELLTAEEESTEEAEALESSSTTPEPETESEERASNDQDDNAEALSEQLPTDMEAAMEEDIAGAALGVSRRNPEQSATSYSPTLPDSGSYLATHSLRSGSEEADWFNRFRQRLAEESSAYQTLSSHSTQEATAGKDPDDPAEDESQTYSEEGE